MLDLASRLAGENERVGFILHDDTIVEVENVCQEPKGGFEVSGADILKHLSIAKATWHTHPGGTANLSVGDYESFLAFPDWDHFIVGTDGTRCFRVMEGTLREV